MSRSVDGVFALDARQTVTFWNQACENMTGIPATYAVGRCCHEVMKGHDLKGKPLCKRDCPVSALAKGGPPPSALPMRIEHSDGQKVQLKLSTLLVPSTSQGEWSIVHVMRHGRVSQPAGLTQESAPAAEAEPAPCPHQVPIGACLLTGREREVLRMLAHGDNTEAMSEQLHLSSTTVRNHIQRLMAKLDVHSRVEAVAYAHRHQLD
jgi:DNA-binding CsgD family transcriptional regulator